MHRMKKERLKEYEDAFTYAIDKALSYEPGIIFFVGDMFHHSRPDPKSFRFLVNSLLSVADKTKVVVCVGNHELEGNLASTYLPMLSDLHENIHVLSTDTPHIYLNVGGKTVGVHGFQFIRGKEQAESTLRKISSDVSGCVNKPDFNVLCMHQAVENYLSPHEISIKCLRDVASKYDLILLGHVHRNQKIKELDVPAYYIGSTERVSFNEAENRTGFLLFRNFDFSSPEFIETPSSPMKKIKEYVGRKTAEEINAYIKKIIEESRDVRCLHIDLEVDLVGDYFEVVTDWHSRYPEFTILNVNVSQKIKDEVIRLEKTAVDHKTFDEFFEKKGLKDRKDLKDLCIKYYDKYGN